MSGNVKRKEGMERIKKAQEEHERAQRKEEARQQSGTERDYFPGGFPGGMPGMGAGMPGMAGMPGLNEILSDPEVLSVCRSQKSWWPSRIGLRAQQICQNIRATQRS